MGKGDVSHYLFLGLYWEIAGPLCSLGEMPREETAPPATSPPLPLLNPPFFVHTRGKTNRIEGEICFNRQQRDKREKKSQLFHSFIHRHNRNTTRGSKMLYNKNRVKRQPFSRSTHGTGCEQVGLLLEGWNGGRRGG